MQMRGVNYFLLAQLAIVGLAAIVALLTGGQQAAISALLGGMVAFIPSVLFTKKAFQFQGARAARLIIRNFYIGEFLKIISSIALFALVFWLYKVTALVFFLTYIVVVMTHWFAPLIIDNKQNRPKSD